MPKTPPPKTPPPEDWYEVAFGDLYNLLYAHRSVEAAAPEALFAAQVLDLKPSDCVLDLCCGNGRHIVHLAQITRHATGLDYSRALLQRARKALGDRARLVRADMRAVPFTHAFHAVTNFFTSFGYFQDDSENMQVITETARALKPSGRVFIDYVNPAFVRDTLEPHTIRRAGDYEIEECRWIDNSEKRINKCARISRNGALVQELGESVRLYEKEELLSFLDRAGLSCDATFGNYSAAPMSPNEPRMIIKATKCP